MQGDSEIDTQKIMQLFLRIKDIKNKGGLYMSTKTELQYKLNMLEERLENYKEFLEDALRENDETMIKKWKNDILGLENEIQGIKDLLYGL